MALANRRLSWVDPGRPNGDEHLTGFRNRFLDLGDVEHVSPAVVIEPHCLGH